MNADRTQLLEALRRAVQSANYSKAMAESIVDLGKNLPKDELAALTARYHSLGKRTAETEQLIDTFNQVMSEEMASFNEEAIDIIDNYLREKAKKEGWTYEPEPNPYRRS